MIILLKVFYSKSENFSFKIRKNLEDYNFLNNFFLPNRSSGQIKYSFDNATYSFLFRVSFFYLRFHNFLIVFLRKKCWKRDKFRPGWPKLLDYNAFIITCMAQLCLNFKKNAGNFFYLKLNFGSGRTIFRYFAHDRNLKTKLILSIRTMLSIYWPFITTSRAPICFNFKQPSRQAFVLSHTMFQQWSDHLSTFFVRMIVEIRDFWTFRRFGLLKSFILVPISAIHFSSKQS